MLMTAFLPDGRGLEYAGWRVLPHVFLPDSWNLPIKIGLTAEISFQRAAFDENTRTLELRPILERSIGRFQIDLNPSVERSLSGGTRSGWSFEPSFRIGYDTGGRLNPSFEYFSADGQVAHLLPIEQQVHQVYPGVDWKLNRSLEWNFGVGAGLTSAGNRFVYKARLEFSFGRKAQSKQ